MAVVVPIVSEWNPKGLDKSLADIQKAEGGWAKAGAGFQAAFVPAIATLGAASAAMWKTTQAASDLGEAADASRRVFGPAADAIADWAKTAATSAGLSETAALTAAQTFGTFGKAAGKTGDDLAGFSIGLTELAGDLASMKNTTPEEAVQALGAALRGESEPMRKYGVLLDDATLRQRALAMGITDTTKEALTPQQKVLAAQAEIFAQTADAQGNFEDTSDSLANQQRTLTAEMDNASAAIGEGFLPVLQKVVPLFQAMATWAKENSDTLSVLVGVIAGVAAAIVAVNMAMKVYQTIATIVTAVQWAMNSAFLANPITWVVLAVIALVAAFVLLWRNNEGFRDFFISMWAKIKAAVGGFVSWVKGAWAVVVALFQYTPVGALITHFETLKRIALQVVDAIKGAFTSLWNYLKGIFDKISGAIGKVGGWLGKIPGLNLAGGMSYAVPSAATFAAGPSPYAVGGGVVVNVSGAIDPERTARQIRSILDRSDIRQGRSVRMRAPAW